MRTSLLLALGALALSAPAASAAPLHCGQTITRDTRLTTDLVNCPGNGIVVDADNVTLDLNGHTLDGVGRQFGVAIVSGRRGVHVTGGTVREFDGGILVYAGVRNVVSDNRLDHNDMGILLFAGGTGNVVTRNRVTHSAGSSIDVSGSANRIEANHLLANGDGIILAGTAANDNDVRDNIVTGTGGIDTGGFGVAVADGASRNRVERNAITGGQGPGPGIIVAHLDSQEIGIGNTIVGNVVNTKSGGIFVDDFSTGTLVARNTVWGNPLDGIYIAAPITTVSANLAIRNGQTGITAVPGVTDGGGNHAFGNGGAQCVGIAC